MDYKLTERDWSLGFFIEFEQLRDAVDIPKDFFSDSAEQREAWAVASELRRSGQPIQTVTIAERCRGNGIVGYLAAITSGLVPMKPEEYRRRILGQEAEDLRRQRRSLCQAERPDEDEIAALSDEIRGLELEAEGEAGPAENVLMTFSELRTRDLSVNWTVDRLLPEGAVTLLYGITGLGKTWLAMMIARAVSTGTPIFKLPTKQKPVVYLDFENPLSNTKERGESLDLTDVKLWHGSFEHRPPKFDSPEWTAYKRILPPHSLIIVDTTRSAHDMKENDSEAAACVLGRLKELRDLGHEALVLHHTPKANDKDAKGTGAWKDLADHTLSFYRHRAGKGDDEFDDEAAFEPGALLSLGTGTKTRYEPMPRLYLILEPDAGGLTLADSPDQTALDALAEHIAGAGLGHNQTELYEWYKDAGLGPRKMIKLRSLLKRGQQEGRWTTRRGLKGAVHYEPPLAGSRASSPYGIGRELAASPASSEGQN